MRWAIPLLMFCLFATGAVADGPSTQPVKTDDARYVRLSSLLQGLANADGSVREQSRIDLMGIDLESLSILRQVVAEHLPLKPSQTIILRDIVSHVYLANTPYPSFETGGFLGVQLGQTEISGDDNPAGNQPTSAVVIVARFPGFGGYGKLLEGDLIMSVGTDSDLSSYGKFQELVRHYSPGQTINLQILRQGKIIPVDAVLSRIPIVKDDHPRMDLFLNERSRAANEYWTAQFSFLLAKQVS